MSMEEKRPLPEGWYSATIPDLVPSEGVFSDGDWVESKDQDPNGDVRLIQLADVGDGFYRDRSERFLTHTKAVELNCTFLEKGDVLIARMPDPLGRACIFPGDEKESVTVVDVCIVRTTLGETNHKWLMYWVNTPAVRAEIESYQSGTTRKRISRKNLAKIEFPVPPLSEQQSIVAEIEKQFTRLDQAVASLKRAQANLQRYKASVLKAACEGNLVPQDPNDESAELLLQRILAERRRLWEEQEWQKLVTKAQKKVAQDGRKAQGLPARLSDLDPEEWQDIPEADYARYLPKNDKWKEKYKEPVAPETAELPPLPEGWVWVTSEQVCDFITKGTTPKAHKLFSNEGPVPFIKVYNLTFDGSLDFSINPSFVATETHNGELARSRVYPGDVLMNIVGPPLGKVSIVPDSHPEWNMNQAIAVFRPLRGVDNHFLMLLLMTDSILSWAKARSKATAGQFNLTLQICRELPLPVAPIDEQRRIVEEVERRLSIIAANEKAIAADLARAERLRQSILQQAFSGRLVPNNTPV